MTTSLTAEESLDLRFVPAAEIATTVLTAFERVPPGESVQIAIPDAGVAALRLLQSKRRGMFEWSVLRQGPPSWTISIARRAAGAEAIRGINEALSWDHDRLDALESEAFRKRAEGDFSAAQETYAVFALGLRRHIAFEEEVLFPAFEEAAGMPPGAGPTEVMRAEHREIEDWIARIEAGISDPGAPIEEWRRSLHLVLGDHNFKEEKILYPGTDELLGSEKADELVGQIQRF